MNKNQLNMIQEEFEIQPLKKLHVLRQDRIDVGQNLARLHIDGESCEVINCSAFGVLVNSKQAINLEAEYTALFSFLEFPVSTLHIRAVRCKRVGDGFEVGFEVLGEPVSVESIKGLSMGSRLIQNQHNYLQLINRIPDEFRHDVYLIKDWLEAMRTEAEELEFNLRAEGHAKEIIENAIAHIVGDHLTQLFPKFYKPMTEKITTYDHEVIKEAMNFFRNQLHHLIYSAPFADRTYNKPRGYAGDYEMMNIIYRDLPEGHSLFTKCIHKYFVSEPAAAAVRNRANYLASKIVETLKKSPGSRLLSLASGPAMELQKILMETPNLNELSGEFYLLDQDEEALKHAQRKLRTLGSKHPNQLSIHYSNLAVKNIITQGLGMDGFDLIYTAGLFDYLTAPVAQVTANRLFNALKPGGRLIIGNFNIDNPSEGIMDLALDWKLIYRSEREMHDMFSILGGRITVEKEHLGINLFTVIEKT